MQRFHSESKKFFRFLEEALKGPKPGLRAQLKMVTNPRPGDKLYHEVEATCIKAGILILFYPGINHWCLVFTRRTERVNFHQAQISFPGGRQDKGENCEQAAVREAHEELHIPPGSVKILGRLTPLYIPPSNYCIYPVVGAADRRPGFKPSPSEVAEVIEIPVEDLLDSKNVRREIWDYKGTEIEVPFFYYKGYKIWGATAMVLAELIELLRERGY